MLAKELGVKLSLVKTTWKDLLDDLNAGRFHLAMGGISATLDRQLLAEQTQGYLTFGKCFLVMRANASQFDSLEKVNSPNVLVGVNIGGTNEEFANKFLPDAKLRRFENNLDVPVALAQGKVQVMITESPEAWFYQSNDEALKAVKADEPFTRSQLCYLMPKGEQRLLNTINFIMTQMRLSGLEAELKRQHCVQPLKISESFSTIR